MASIAPDETFQMNIRGSKPDEATFSSSAEKQQQLTVPLTRNRLIKNKTESYKKYDVKR